MSSFLSFVNGLFSYFGSFNGNSPAFNITRPFSLFPPPYENYQLASMNSNDVARLLISALAACPPLVPLDWYQTLLRLGTVMPMNVRLNQFRVFFFLLPADQKNIFYQLIDLLKRSRLPPRQAADIFGYIIARPFQDFSLDPPPNALIDILALSIEYADYVKLTSNQPPLDGTNEQATLKLQAVAIHDFQCFLFYYLFFSQ